MDSKIHEEKINRIDDSGGGLPFGITELLSEMGEKLLHPFEAMRGTAAPCEHDWAPVRMVKFDDASSEVMRCLKCGSVDIVERKSA